MEQRRSLYGLFLFAEQCTVCEITAVWRSCRLGLVGRQRRGGEGRHFLRVCGVLAAISLLTISTRSCVRLRQQWDETLARVPYEGNSRERRIFYTALYHTLLMPVDKTGECPRWSGTPYYDDFYALWDTYRTSMPLLMEYYPERATDIVRALLAIYRHEGYMPDARSGDCNGRTQEARMPTWSSLRPIPAD